MTCCAWEASESFHFLRGDGLTLCGRSTEGSQTYQHATDVPGGRELCRQCLTTRERLEREESP